jgi:hypothetical protein
VDVPPGAVTAIRDADEQKEYERLLKPGLLQLWSGGGSVGLAGANGNARTLTFTTSVNAARTTKTDKTLLHFSLIKASALINGKNADTAQAVRGGIGYDHNVRSRLFVNTFNDYEYDKFQDLDLRFVIGGGFGSILERSGPGSQDQRLALHHGPGAHLRPVAHAGSGSAPVFWRRAKR